MKLNYNKLLIWLSWLNSHRFHQCLWLESVGRHTQPWNAAHESVMTKATNWLHPNNESWKYRSSVWINRPTELRVSPVDSCSSWDETTAILAMWRTKCFTSSPKSVKSSSMFELEPSRVYISKNKIQRPQQINEGISKATDTYCFLS